MGTIVEATTDGYLVTVTRDDGWRTYLCSDQDVALVEEVNLGSDLDPLA